MQNNNKSANTSEMVADLLEIVRDISIKVHAHRSDSQNINLDSAFEGELGLDSLARVELLARLERHFNLALAEDVFAVAESPRDLLRALQAANGNSVAVHSPAVPATKPEEIQSSEVQAVPEDATTLVEVLHWHIQKHPDRQHIHLLSDEEQHPHISYRDLWENAQKIASGLQHYGIQSGDTVAIMLPTCREYFLSFFGILLAGAIPVPLYPPIRRSQLEEHLRRHKGILRNCSAQVLITFDRAKVFAQLLKSQVPSLLQVSTVEDLLEQADDYQPPVIKPDDIAFLQYTSGSTGNPKGVMLTHRNLLANIRAMGVAAEADSTDVFVSWLPLYHDMGLIGSWLSSLYFSATFISLSPLAFLTRPLRWLQAIDQYGGTLSASPNFGYELCMKRISDEEIAELDLSSWRLAFNGAEPVSPATVTDFADRFASADFSRRSMHPVYGLAESTVGLAFPSLHQELKIDRIQRKALMQQGRAVPAKAQDETAQQFVGCGHALQGHQVRIVDDNNRELPERYQGSLQFMGPSSTSGYYHNPEQTRLLFDGKWLNSGDLAYMAEGEIYITGRSKDIIIRAGRNIYPHELEEAVGNIPGIRKGCVVAFGSSDPASGTEQLVIVAETNRIDEAQRNELQSQIIAVLSALLDAPPDVVVLVRAHAVLKTSSGKIRRSSNRELYELGKLDATSSPVPWQMLKMLFASVVPLGQRAWRNVKANLFAVYSWSLFVVLASIGWLAVVLLPRYSWRWATLKFLAGFLARATMTPLQVQGLDNLRKSDRPVVVVANHCSFIDVYALVAVLPMPISFVAKSEFTQQFYSRLFLKRMRAETVERADNQQGVRDVQRMTSVAGEGRSLLFFPEGTFTRSPGLLPFRMGAFVTAEKTGLPVIPIAIRGTRSMLRAGSWFPHPGKINITIGEAIENQQADKTADNSWEAALKLRDTARAFILGQQSVRQNAVQIGKM